MIDFLTDNSGTVGLLFFFSVFCMIALRSFRPSVKEEIESHKNIPLMED
ncbi:cbb3-type cytochrome c oxidase subunit 3 [Temperatibacter marinus]|uniref:Cbb3-type cytochrome c oxidase subunit 3 n=1 Tax=Temperatibacter marinus TaxID=1456591 RepID=A0AA52EIG4_9PROT|nr:cbb3-type cytochrome c oxidase subunit 3 [Temperatibacter marinus]WND03400.1 cbb3-type cytochrome c oxidase subunit 3 [Temperatibacter marinus]